MLSSYPGCLLNNLLKLLLVWLWLLTWFLFRHQAGCLPLALLLVPVVGLIALNMLESALLRRRARVHMFLREEGWLARWLSRRLLLMIWQVAKALLFALILFVEMLSWPLWILWALLADLLMLSLLHAGLKQGLSGQVKPGYSGFVTRRLLVGVNTLVLALGIASGQFFSLHPDYRSLTWQETVVEAAGRTEVGCELIAPVARATAVRDAIGWRLMEVGAEHAPGRTTAIAGWLLFLLSSLLFLWAWSRLLMGALISRTELVVILEGRNAG